jgi:hypothetical protein
VYSTVEGDTQERRIEKYKDKEETGSKFTLARHIRIENMSTQRTLALNSTDKYEQTSGRALQNIGPASQRTGKL